MIVQLLSFMLALVIGYSIGSVPFAFLMAKMVGIKDIRDFGSGNVGTSNVLRTGRISCGVLVMFLDIGKGILAVLLVRGFGVGVVSDFALTAGIASVVGHIYPAWLSFRGGKGVATVMGVALATFPALGLSAILVGIAVFYMFRYMFLASLCATFFLSVISLFFTDLYTSLHFVPVVLLIFAKHAPNMRRFLDGKETPLYLTSKVSS